MSSKTPTAIDRRPFFCGWTPPPLFVSFGFGRCARLRRKARIWQFYKIYYNFSMLASFGMHFHAEEWCPETPTRPFGGGDFASLCSDFVVCRTPWGWNICKTTHGKTIENQIVPGCFGFKSGAAPCGRRQPRCSAAGPLSSSRNPGIIQII